jgi:hypothetical protein
MLGDGTFGVSMDYKDALRRLEEFRALIEEYKGRMYSSDKETQSLARRLYEKYGEVENIIEQFAGRSEIAVPIHGEAKPVVYPNLIEAGYLSGRSIHAHEGYTQLLKIIGKVRQLAEDPVVPRDEQSLSGVVRVLGRFRECCQYLRETPTNERDVQDIAWIMLRSHFDRVDREDTLPRFGVKNYRPDFGIPELRTLIEIKFVGEKTRVPDIQEEILGDVPGYLTDQARYDSLIICVYDAAHKLRDPRKFIEDIRKVEGIVDVIVVPGLG